MSASDLRRAAGALLIAIAALSVWWYWRVIRPARYAALTILNYDLYAEVVPRLEYAYSTLRHGHLPLWNPYQLAGTPFLAIQQHAVLYPLNLAHLFLPLSSALSVTAVLHYAIAALATFSVARDLGLSRLGALLAAVAYALSGNMFGKLYLPPHLYASAWIPVQLLVAHRLYARGVTFPRVAALAAACALQFVGGHAQYCLFAAYLFAAYLAWQLVTSPTRLALRTAVALAASAVLSLALSAAQLLPTVELTLQSPRRPGVLGAANMAGDTPLTLLRDLLLPGPLPGIAGDFTYGIVLLFLALVGLLHRDSIRERGFLIAGSLALLPMATGSSGPFYPLLHFLPAYDWFRLPGRILVVLTLFTALLSAAGLQQLQKAETRTYLLRLTLGPLLMLALGAIVLLHNDSTLLTLAPWRRFWWLAAALLCAFLVPNSAWRGALIAGIAVLELVLLHENAVVIPETDPDFYRPPADAVAYLHQHQGVWRTLVTDGMEPMFQFERQNPPKTGLLARVYSISDYENLYPDRYRLFLAALQRREPLPEAWQGRIYGNADTVDRRLLDLLGVRFVLTSRLEPFARRDDSRFPVVFPGEASSVLESPAALPRAYLANVVVPVSDVPEALSALRQPPFESAHSITIEGWTGPVDTLGPVEGTAEVTLYEPERVNIQARTANAVFLVLSDQHYPGWTARVDGEPTPIYRANGVFRAVRLSAGEHLVEFTFAPWSFRLGAALSLLSLAAVGSALLRRPRSSEPARSSSAVHP